MSDEKNIHQLGGCSLTASEYYYDCPSDTWDNMLYPDALLDRYKRCKQLYFKLYKLQVKGVSWEDHVRFFKVEKAYKDTKQLLDERNLIL